MKELIAFLEENKNRKVSSIIDDVKAMMVTSPRQNVTFKRDEDGEVTEVFCYYHKEWELVSEHAYGAKKSTATGLNTMCKAGVSAWTKQQRVAKQKTAELLDRVMSGELAKEDVQAAKDAIEVERRAIN